MKLVPSLKVHLLALWRAAKREAITRIFTVSALTLAVAGGLPAFAQGSASTAYPLGQTFNIASQGNSIDSVAVDAAGDIFVGNYGTGTLVKNTYNAATGTYTSAVIATSTHIGSVAVNAAGTDVFFISYSNSNYGLIQSVLKYSGSGTSYGQSGNALGTSGFGSTPFSLALDASENVYLAYDQTIERIPANNYTSPTVLVHGNYNAPSFLGIAVDASGSNIYALTTSPGNSTDTLNHYDNTGASLGSSTIPAATDIAVDGGENVYLGSGNGTITKVTPAGTNITVAINATASGRTAPNGDAAPLAVDAHGNLYVGTVGSSVREYVPVTSFGQVPVGSNSNTLTVAFTVTGTAASASVVTQGEANLDFSAANAGINCSAAVSGVSTCTVGVVFNPLAPGMRSGAVELLDANANVLATASVNGVGTGALAVITPGTIATVVGNGAASDTGDGGSPTAATLFNPSHIVVDALGDQYIAMPNNTVREVSAATGTITTIAGVASQQGYTGDGGPATSATFHGLTGIALDGAGNLYIADQNNNAVRVVSAATGIVNTLVSTGSGSYPLSVGFNAAGDLYIGGTSAIYKYSMTTGALTTIAGIPGSAGTSGDGGAATAGQVAYIYSLAFDPSGDLIFISGGSNTAVREVNTAGTLNTLIPTGDGNFQGLSIDPAGDIFLADVQHNDVIKVSPAAPSVLTVVAGNGAATFAGDGGAATAASLNYPTAVAFDGNGDLYIADQSNQRIRMVTATAASFTFPGINPVTNPVTTASTTDTVIFANQGNIPLTLTANGGNNPSLDAPFGMPSGTCVPVTSTAMTLAAGASCTESINFTPTAAGSPVTGNLVFTDNSDNPSSIDQQVVAFAGEAYVPVVTMTTIAVSPTANVQQGATATLTASVSTSDSSAPTGNLQFFDNGTPVGSPIASGSAFTLPDVLTAGEHNFTASFTGVQFDLSSLSNTATVVATPLTAVGTPSTSLSRTVTITTAGTFGSVAAVTKGITGLDFASTGTTCSGSLSVGQSCVVNYTFTPKYSGQRLGAVEVLDASGNILGSTLVSGTGNGPQAILYSGNKAGIVPTLYGGAAVTVDAAGNLYYANRNIAYKETLSNGTYTESTLTSGVGTLGNIVVDGAGKVYIADESNNVGMDIFTPSSGGYIESTILTGVQIQAFAVDSAGNILYAPNNYGSIVEANASSNYAVTTVATLPNPITFLAVAPNGDVFAAENTGSATGDVAMFANGTYARSVISSGGLVPDALALNPDGSLYVTDAVNDQIVRLVPNGTATYTSTTIDTTTAPDGIAVGATGNLYVTDATTKEIVKFDVVTAPTLSFATTVEGNTSTDSPKSITLSNVGNQPLNFVVPSAGSNPSVSANFTYSSSSTCNAAQSATLAPGAACTEVVNFTPTSTGNITGSAVTSDNSLNLSPATQIINLAGASDLSTTTALVISAANPTLISTSITLTATITASDTSNAVGSVIFYDGTSVLQTVTVSGGKAVLTLTLPAGVHSLSAVYSATLPYTGSQAAAQTLKVYGQPIGNLDTVENTRDGSTTFVYGDTLFVGGWAADPTDGSPITVYVTLDGSRVPATTGQQRADVAAYFNNPNYLNSGYSLAFPASHFSVGTHTVSVTVINQGGVTQSFRSVTINVLGAPPTGNVENVEGATSQSARIASTDSLLVSGWAGDPNPANGASAASVTVLIDGKAYAATLNLSRPDVASTTGETGYAHSGFTFSLAGSSLTPGQHTIGVIATGATGLTTTFPNHTVTILAPAPDVSADVAEDPTTGSTNYVSEQDNLFVAGWAADFQIPGNVSDVSIYIDGSFFGHATLGGSRPDVATYLNNQAYANAGWTFTMSAATIPVGSHIVTAVATDHAGLTTTTSGLTIGVNNYTQKAHKTPQQ